MTEKSIKQKGKRVLHPNSLANLTHRLKPGETANRIGWSLTSELKHKLSKLELRHKVVESTIKGAILREPTPFREVWDRVEGKLGDRMEVELRGQLIVYVDGKKIEGPEIDANKRELQPG